MRLFDLLNATIWFVIRLKVQRCRTAVHGRVCSECTHRARTGALPVLSDSQLCSHQGRRQTARLRGGHQGRARATLRAESTQTQRALKRNRTHTHSHLTIKHMFYVSDCECNTRRSIKCQLQSVKSWCLPRLCGWQVFIKCVRFETLSWYYFIEWRVLRSIQSLTYIYRLLSFTTFWYV